MEYIIDSYAWIEYFIGSTKGEILNKLFSNKKDNFFTVECCLAEVNGWAIREKQDFERLFKIIKANSGILHLSQEDWIDAAKERFEQRKKQKDFGLIDAVILVKQKELRCKVVSGDSHFKKLKGVVFLE
jgi:predicted nucleic acid-binding protein